VKPGGTHPPFTHVHPRPGIGVTHCEEFAGGADGGAGAGAAGPVGNPGGSQPPFTHVHPAPGGGVAQVGFGGTCAGAGGGGGGGGGATGTPPVVNIHTPCARSRSAIVLATIRQKYVVCGCSVGRTYRRGC
jgi:hypothetical protein